jgi:hypothetical protein
MITLLGVFMIIVGAANGLSIAGSSIQVNSGWKIVIVIIGAALMCFGAYLTWREAVSEKKTDASSSERQGVITNKLSGIQVFDEVNTAFLDIKSRILKGDIKVVQAELIQHSSERAHTLVRALADVGAGIKLYLQHPDTLSIICGDLKQRVTARLGLYPQDLEGQNYKGDLQIYLYKTPASFNGVRLLKKDGSFLLLLSWYTYKSYVPLNNLIDSKFGGSANPCLVIDSAHPEYTHFNNFFNDLINSCEKQGTPPVFQMKNGKYEWLSGWPVD